MQTCLSSCRRRHTGLATIYRELNRFRVDNFTLMYIRLHSYILEISNLSFFFSSYFPYIFNMSGTRESYEKFGSWFSYDGAPRAQMFKRDHNKVVDMDSMMKLMRFVCFSSNRFVNSNEICPDRWVWPKCLELDCQTRRFTFAYFCQLLHLDTSPLFVFYLMV